MSSGVGRAANKTKIMKKAKFAPVTASLVTRNGKARLRNGNSHGGVAPVMVDFPSYGGAAEDVADDKLVLPPFAISGPPTRSSNLVAPGLPQSDSEHLGLIAAKHDTARQYSSPAEPHFANSGAKTESDQSFLKWALLKAIWSGFQAFGHGPRL